MSDEISNAEKYLEARLAECLGRPELHKNTSDVYNNYLKIIRERPQDYVREAGDMFPVMKGEQLDRNENYLMLYKKFSQKERVEAYTIRAKAVRESTGYGDFYTKNGQAQKETEHLIGLEYKKRELLADIMRRIISWKVALDAEKGSCKTKVLGLWKSLLELDPDLNWQKLSSFPPYRNSIYYNNGQMSMLENWFREISK
jgi:hypothetical protein